ncbi:MAG: hypothetical protein ACYTEW_24535 [Planctomycetota bacterium]
MKKRKLIFLASLTLGLFCTWLLVSATPSSPGDYYRFEWDSAFDKTYNESATYQPVAWLYNQSNNVVSGATVSYAYFDVDANEAAISSGTATDNGDGSYTAGIINMASTYNDKHVRVDFTVTVGAYTLTHTRTVFGGSHDPAEGAVWKFEILNTSLGPSIDSGQTHNLYMRLYGDGATPIRNNQRDPSVSVDGGGDETITYLEDGMYNVTLSSLAVGEHHIAISTTFDMDGKRDPSTARKDLYIESVSGQGDEQAPVVLDMEVSPVHPTSDGNVSIIGKAFDNVGLSSVVLYYSLNSETWNTISMTASDGYTYSAEIDSSEYYPEDALRYYINATDAAGNSYITSTVADFVAPPRTGEINSTRSYLNHQVFWFGKTRQSGNVMEGGDTAHDGTYGDADDDGVLYLWVGGGAIHDAFMDMSTIKLYTLALNERGEMMSNKTITAWLQANTSQSAGTKNRAKNMTWVDEGYYNVSWQGAYDFDGSSTVTWTDDSKAIWGAYESGRTYSIYVDFTQDGVADENITFLAYNLGDTFWYDNDAADKDPKGGGGGSHADFEKGTCGRASCHIMGGSSRTADRPTCPDCHGVSKEANGGTWPIAGTTSAVDDILYGNSTGHPRKGSVQLAYNCTNSACHNVAFGSGPPNDVTIPGYSAGTQLDATTDATYQNPSQCASCHTFVNSTIPTGPKCGEVKHPN